MNGPWNKGGQWKESARVSETRQLPANETSSSLFSFSLSSVEGKVVGSSGSWSVGAAVKEPVCAAYKPQKFTSHGPGGWQVQVQGASGFGV